MCPIGSVNEFHLDNQVVVVTQYFSRYNALHAQRASNSLRISLGVSITFYCAVCQNTHLGHPGKPIYDAGNNLGTYILEFRIDRLADQRQHGNEFQPTRATPVCWRDAATLRKRYKAVTFVRDRLDIPWATGRVPQYMAELADCLIQAAVAISTTAAWH